MEAEDKWAKLEKVLESTLRKVIREEFAAIGFKPKTKISFVAGRWVGISDEQMYALKEAYPALDLDAELKRAAAWIAANPMMAPKSQHGRFINSWMAKAQNQASLRSIPTRQAEPPKMKYCSYCERVASGAPNNIWACPAHFDDAMSQKPRAHMLGVVAKPVAGNDG